MNKINHNPVDRFLSVIDEGLRSVFGQPQHTGRNNPSRDVQENDMDEQEIKNSIGLMRVNHSGEVSAQGLYQGQALTAKLPDVRESMEQAAKEENDHLSWCRGRVEELGGHTSILDPVWYAGSFAIGAMAGIAGDKWSLGFVAETEHQVVNHLDDHLELISGNDIKSRAIIEQMKEDEARHATVALDAGGADLPVPVRKAMGVVSKLMTTTAYRL